jgi:hypothetical protein
MHRLLLLTTVIAIASAQDWALARLQKSPLEKL